jgi:thymidine phosphorylase
MKDVPAARKLARALVSVGRRAGKRVVALVTDMSSPIGLTIGNGLETREAIEVLKNAGPRDTRELTLALGAEMLLLGKVTRSASTARATLERALADGSAFERFLRLVHAQGGDLRSVEHPERLTRSKARVPVRATRSGTVRAIDPLELGLVSVALGAGRTRAEQKVDARAGIEIAAPLGSSVSRGDPLAWLCARRSSLAEAQVERVRGAFTLGRGAPARPRRVLERLA